MFIPGACGIFTTGEQIKEDTDMNNSTSINKNNVIDMFNKKSVGDNQKVDYTLVDELQRRRNAKSSKTSNRNNLVVLFPGFCA